MQPDMTTQLPLQLPLPVDVPLALPQPRAPIELRMIPTEVWANLNAPTQAQIRQVWLRVLQEVANAARER
jgi:hypothetical protein